MSLSSLSEQLALPVSVSNDVLEFMKKERLAEVKMGGTFAPRTRTPSPTRTGEAREYLQLSGYFGAPLSPCAVHGSGEETDDSEMSVNRESMDRAFEGSS